MPLEAALDVSVTADRVEFVFTVDNTGAEPVELRFRSGQRADVVVREDGSIVWRWSAGRMFTQVLSQEELEPGATRSYDMTWEDPVAGEYSADALLAAADVEVEASARFTVP
jgi:hypothetical protein